MIAEIKLCTFYFLQVMFSLIFFSVLFLVSEQDYWKNCGWIFMEGWKGVGLGGTVYCAPCGEKPVLLGRERTVRRATHVSA